MKRYLFLYFLFVLTVGNGYCENSVKTRLLIFPFENRGGLRLDYVNEMIPNSFFARFKNLPQYSLVSPGVLKEYLDSKNYTPEDLLNLDTRLWIARVLNANRIIQGFYGEENNRFFIRFDVIDVPGNRLIYRVEKSGKSGIYITDTLGILATEYLNKTDPYDKGEIEVKKTARVATIAGLAGKNSSNDGKGSVARFNHPSGITSDELYLYVADRMNHTVRRIEKSTGSVTTIAGLAGNKGSTDGIGSKARFNTPNGITCDDQYIYVADTMNHTIRRIQKSTGNVATIAGRAGENGNCTCDNNGIIVHSKEGTGKTSDGKYFYIAETSNSSATKETERCICDGIGSAARFNEPSGITCDGKYIYITDTSNFYIRKIDKTTGMVSTVILHEGHDPLFDFSSRTNEGYLPVTRLILPWGIASEGEDKYFYLTDDNSAKRIEKSSGDVILFAGNLGTDLTSKKAWDNNGRLKSQFEYNPDKGPVANFYDSGITTDRDFIYVTYYQKHTIRRIEKTTRITETISGTYGKEGSYDGVLSAALFSWPTGITNDEKYLYVADSGNSTIRRIEKPGIDSFPETNTPAAETGLKDRSDEKEKISNESATITMGLFDNWEKAYTAVFNSKEFKAVFPNVVIKMQTSEFTAHHERLKARLTSHTKTNDIEAIEAGFIGYFIKAGGLTNFLEPPYNGLDVGKELAPFCLARAMTRDEKLVAFPVDVSPAVLFYRKSAADACGADLTNLASWDDYITEAKKITRDTNNNGIIDQYALCHPVDLARTLINGGILRGLNEINPYEPEGTFKNVLQLITKVGDAKISPKLLYWSQEWVNAFKTGKIVTHCGGVWMQVDLKYYICPKSAGDWRIAPLPGHTYAFSGGTYLSIPARVPDEKKQLAWKIIKYLCTNRQAQLTALKLTEVFPALTTVYDDPLMSEPDPYFGGQKVREIYREIALHIEPHEITEGDVDAAKIFDDAMWEVFGKNKSAEQAYDYAKEKLSSAYSMGR
jgi:multiple sugar transport system substrate-binding protein